MGRFLDGLDSGRRVSKRAEAWTDGQAAWEGGLTTLGRKGRDAMCVAGNEMSSSAPEVLGAGSNGLSVWVSSRREAAMASSTTPVSFLAPPLEQLRHLAEELRSLLPRVRGELWESATPGSG